MNLADSDDIALWKQLRSGSRKAFEHIYNVHYDALYCYGRGMKADTEVVEDAIQDLFVNLWKRRESLSDTDNIRAYLLVSLRHRILKLFKKQARYEPKVEEESFSSSESSIEERIIDEEFSIELNGLLKQSFAILSNRQRQAIYLRYLESMEYEDICTVMEINYQSVRNLISGGIKKLAVDLKKKI